MNTDITEGTHKGVLKNGKINGHKAEWFKKEDEGNEVEYVVRKVNPRYECVYGLFGINTFHYYFIAYPAFINLQTQPT